MGEGEKIRREIKGYLEKNGRARTNELHPYIMEKCKVSPKPVYRELNNLVMAKQIKKIEHNKAEVYYERIDFDEYVKKFENHFKKLLDNFDEKFNDWHSRMKKLGYEETLEKCFPLLHIIQNIDSTYKMLLHSKIIKNSKSFKDLEQEINKRFKNLLIKHDGLNEKNTNYHQDIVNQLHYEIIHEYHRKYEEYDEPA